MAINSAALRSDIESLVRLYSSAERRLLSLPLISLHPLWSGLKASFKIIFLLPIDIIIIPWNAVVLFNRLFRGRMRYRGIAFRQIGRLIVCIRNGEFYAPTIFLRPLTRFFVVDHFYRRLSTIRRLVLLDNELRESEKSEIAQRIDKCLDMWQRPLSVLLYMFPNIAIVYPLHPVICLCYFSCSYMLSDEESPSIGQ